MSQYSVTDEVCTEVIQSMGDILGSTSMNLRRTKYGALNAALSQVNTTDRVSIDYDQGGGFHRDVRIWYYQRAEDDDILSSIPATCTTTNEFKPCPQTFSVANEDAFGFRVRSSDVAKLCKSEGGMTEHIRRGFMLSMEAFLRRINSTILTSLEAGVGTNIATGLTTTTTLDLYDDATGQVNAPQWQTFREQMEDDNQLNAPPIVIAQGGFARANRMMSYGCCNDAGLDFAGILAQTEAAGWSFFKDQQIDATIGANRAFVIAPGSFQFVPHLDYADTNGAGSIITGNSDAYGSYELSNGLARGVFSDPGTNMMFDIKIVPDDCLDVINVFGKLKYDVWTAPTDMTKSNDHLAGQNGIFDYTFT